MPFDQDYRVEELVKKLPAKAGGLVLVPLGHRHELGVGGRVESRVHAF
jgi:hypothetical protein